MFCWKNVKNILKCKEIGKKMTHKKLKEWARNNLIFAAFSALFGIFNIYIGVVWADSSTNDPIIYTCIGIALLLFDIWFVIDTLSTGFTHYE